MPCITIRMDPLEPNGYLWGVSLVVSWTWQFFVTFLGWLSDLLERLSDLQLGDQKVTLNHLGVIISLISALFFFFVGGFLLFLKKLSFYTFYWKMQILTYRYIYIYI